MYNIYMYCSTISISNICQVAVSRNLKAGFVEQYSQNWYSQKMWNCEYCYIVNAGMRAITRKSIDPQKGGNGYCRSVNRLGAVVHAMPVLQLQKSKYNRLYCGLLVFIKKIINKYMPKPNIFCCKSIENCGYITGFFQEKGMQKYFW